MYSLVRETAWIKEWQTPAGAFIDSKLRWLGVEPNADAFIAAWKGATPPEKFDLEAAFEFYPYELEDDVHRILSAVETEDPARAQRMYQRLFKADSQLSAQQQQFLEGLGRHLEEAGSPMRLVGENKWFAAYANDAGFHIESRVSLPLDFPTDEELQSHIDASLSLAYRRNLQTVKENKWLLEPRPGEKMFPRRLGNHQPLARWPGWHMATICSTQAETVSKEPVVAAMWRRSARTEKSRRPQARAPSRSPPAMPASWVSSPWAKALERASMRPSISIRNSWTC